MDTLIDDFLVLQLILHLFLNCFITMLKTKNGYTIYKSNPIDVKNNLILSTLI